MAWRRHGYTFELHGVKKAARINLRVYECEDDKEYVDVRSALVVMVGVDGVLLSKPVEVNGPIYKAFVHASEVEYEKAREHAVLVLERVWLKLMQLPVPPPSSMPLLSEHVNLREKFNVSKTVRMYERFFKDNEDACTLCATGEPANAIMPCNVHAFCFGCVSRWWRAVASIGRTELTCPNCRQSGKMLRDKTTGKEYSLPTWRLRSLPAVNYSVQSDVESEE